MENIQVLLLLIAVGVTLRAAIKSTAKRSWLFAVTLSLLFTSLIVRELDIDSFGTHPRWDDYETLLRTLLVITWLFWLHQIWIHRMMLIREPKAIILTPATGFTLLGILLYVFSWPFDKGLTNLSINASMFVEEALQIGATSYFLLGGLWVLFRHPHHESQRRH